MNGAQIIVLATPVFLGLIALEWWWGKRRGVNTYRAADALSSIGLGMMSQLVGLFSKIVTVGLYTLAFQHVSMFKLEASAWWVWPIALGLYDFLYYWYHRLAHRVALFWAAHVVHHQSEAYNLSTALRQTSSGWLVGWIVYMPMAVLGFPPLVFGTVALIDLLYQFWVHTQQVGKLGWFDRVFCSPSNHRVHHAVNDAYVDRNYGGILIVWDRLFGTFAEERDDEPCVYGTRAPLRSWNPLWANVEVYASLWRDSKAEQSWANKLKVWFMPPGWQSDDAKRSRPKPIFELSKQSRFESAASPLALTTATGLLSLSLGLSAVLLWWSAKLAWVSLVLGTLTVVAMLWLMGQLCSRQASGEPDAVPHAPNR